MRVVVFSKAVEGVAESMAAPTPEMLEAFAAMDAFTEELVQAGVFVAAAGLKNGPEARRIVGTGTQRKVLDGPFADPHRPAQRRGMMTPEALGPAEALRIG